jgi:hypothetical protein
MKAGWDTAKGQKLWEEGASLGKIGTACKISRHAAAKYAKRHWPERSNGRRQEEYFHAPRQPDQVKPKRVARGAPTLAPLASLDSSAFEEGHRT